MKGLRPQRPEKSGMFSPQAAGQSNAAVATAAASPSCRKALLIRERWETSPAILFRINRNGVCDHIVRDYPLLLAHRRFDRQKIHAALIGEYRGLPFAFTKLHGYRY